MKGFVAVAVAPSQGDHKGSPIGTNVREVAA